MKFNGGVACINIAPQVDVSTALYDRTQGRDGNLLSNIAGRVGTGDISVGEREVAVLDRNYPAGSQVEVVLQTVITAPSGFTWNRCEPAPGLRHVRPCRGLGTNTLTAWHGTGSFPTVVQHPPEECRVDEAPMIGTGPTSTEIIRLVPHIRYCGYFDMGSNSRITRVEKVLTTEIRPVGFAVCNANFFPDPPAADGTPETDGRFGRFRVQVRVTTGPCSDVSQPASFMNLHRSYQPNGTVQILDYEA